MTTTATATSTLSLSAPVMAPIAASSSSSSGSLGSSCPALERKSSESYCTEALETMVCNSEAFVLSLITEASKLSSEDTYGSPAEYVPKAIAWISVAEGKGQRLMDFCVRREIQHTSAPNLLLREETSFTRAMSLFANLEGFLFLEDVVKPAVKTILSKKVSFEITETKEPSHEERVKNSEAVVKVMKAVLDGCLKNAKKLSQSFRQLFSELDAVTNEKFPGYGKKAAGVCFFLRFLCPNLIHPELYGLVGAVPAEKRRRLIIITQLLQQLINCWSNDSLPYVSPDASASEDLGPSIVAELLARYAPKIDDFITKHLLLPKKGKKSLTSYMCWKDADAKVDQQAKMLYHFVMHHSSSILPHLSSHDCETLVASLEDAQNKSLKRSRPRAATVVKLVWSY